MTATHSDESDGEKSITIGKLYEVLEQDEDYVKVNNDYGYVFWYTIGVDI